MIKKLLKLEFIKHFAYTNFWVLTGLWAGLYFLVVLIVSLMNINIPGLESKPYLQFPSVWTTFTWIASWFNLLLAIIIIVSVGNEFSYKTFRSQVINGLSRNELILGKSLFILLIAITCTLFVFILTLIFGIIYTNFGSETSVFNKSWLLPVYFIQAIGYMTIGMLIAIIIKNTALSIVSFILYFFPVEVIIRNIFPDTIGQFFPMKIISNLTPLPDMFHIAPASSQMYTSINGQQMAMQATPPVPELAICIAVTVAIIYIIAFITSSTIIVNKRNL
ncbi:MAG: ABC transporter permease [Bacteroidia bacterium]|nr:ABC transporter permease [Bacteroidia bacterium]